MWEDMEAASVLQLAIVAPASISWVVWYVRRWGNGGRWRWWQKPFVGYFSLIMMGLPFRVASVPLGVAPTGIPEQEPIFAVGAVLVILAFVAWCVSGHIRLAVHALLAERQTD